MTPREGGSLILLLVSILALAFAASVGVEIVHLLGGLLNALDGISAGSP